jgi:Holliday junction resolvasome RuvABC endonuclease subunit
VKRKQATAKRRNVVVQGWDISLNHGAVVQLRNGELDAYWFYSDKAGSVARGKKHGARVELPTPTRQPDKHIRSIIRLDWVSRWIERVALATAPGYVALEDYAIGADQGAHYLGEIGGQARRLMWAHGVRYRLHDPIAVKLFIAHDATAQKDLIEASVRDRWGVDFGHCNAVSAGKGRPSRQTSEDLADAFGLAQMAWTEYRLRKGLVHLSSLHEKEIQVFNRATKAFPINVLGREWIRKPRE